MELTNAARGLSRRKRIPVWIIPILGIVLGVLYAYMFIHGLVVTWQFIGKPSENIAHIIGFVGGHTLFVETENGNVYSIEYYNYLNGNEFLPTPIEWKKELNSNIQPDPQRIPIMKFVSLPLFVKVKQMYEMEFPLIEGEFLVKFALAEDGNLWMWNYGIGGFSVVAYIIFPGIGFGVGMISALMISVAIFIWEKVRK